MMAALRRFAFARPRAFPVLGWGGASLWHALRDEGSIHPSRAPHDADLLVLAGEIPETWGKRIAALFETFGLPRLALWLRPDWDCSGPPGLPARALLPYAGVSTIDWDRVTEALLDGRGHGPLLPDEPPSPWRGRGDHGQGGEGMMGGKPYGRPMAMTMADPDGLALDDVPTRLGPWFPGLPSGLELELRLQGDRIRCCEAIHNRFPSHPPEWFRYGGAGNSPALQILTGRPMGVADVEQARLENHLGWMTEFLGLAGLEAAAEAVHRQRQKADPEALERLVRRIDGPLLRRLGRGVGVIDKTDVARLGLTGPVARASGVAEDARQQDPGYRSLNLAVQVRQTGDVWARWQVRAGECLESARLVRQAGEATTTAGEGPRGGFAVDETGLRTATAANLAVLQEKLAGLEWHEAVLFIASLDLDMAEAALR